MLAFYAMIKDKQLSYYNSLLAMNLMDFLLKPSAFTEKEQSRTGRLLRWILLSGLILNTFNLGILIIFAPETLPTFWLNGLLFVVIFVSFALLRQGRVYTASACYCSSLWGIITYYALISGGVTSPAFGFLSLVIIASAVLLGTNGAIASGLLCVVTGAVLIIAYHNNWVTAAEAPPTPDRLFATQTTIFLGLSILLAISSRSMYQALTFAYRAEQTLGDQNALLQREIQNREQIQQEQARLAAILEQTSDIVGMSDQQGVVFYLNQSGRKLAGLSPDYDITSTHVKDYHPADVADHIIEEAIPIALRDGIWVGETIFRTQDGHEIPVSQVIIAHYNQNHQPEFISSIMRDLSEQKQAEKRQIEFTLEQERFNLFKEFLNNVSHDIRTPLTIIRNNLYLIERLDDPQKRSQMVENIRQQTLLLEKYVADMLLLSRLDRLPSLRLADVDCNQLVQDEHRRLLPLLEQKDISTHLSLDNDLPRIAADEQEMRRVLGNLIENAINYTPAGGAIGLQTAHEENSVIIRISDTGIGIPANDLPRIFDRHYRSQVASDMRPGGTGLGLAIVKRIIEMHSGRIEVESEPNKGTTFSIWLSSADATRPPGSSGQPVTA
jgi:PAS domain S-box-containing protein